MAARRPTTAKTGRRPTGLAIAPPDLSAGGEWKEKRRRRSPAYFLVSLDVPIDREDLEGHP